MSANPNPPASRAQGAASGVPAPSASGPSLGTMTEAEYNAKAQAFMKWLHERYGVSVDPRQITVEFPRDLMGNVIGGPKFKATLPNKAEIEAVGTPDGASFVPAGLKEGTASAASTTNAISAPPTQEHIVSQRPDGSTTSAPNPNYVDPDRITPAKQYEYDKQRRDEQVADQTREENRLDRADARDERAHDRNAKAELDRYNAEVRKWEAEAADRRAAAQAERDRLRFLIDERKITMDEAQAEYDRWWKENVELPFKQASEARSRTQEYNENIKAEQEHKNYVAEYEKQRALQGYRGTQDVLGHQKDLLKYTYGKGFSDKAAANINALSKGKSGPGWNGSEFRITLPKALQEVNGMSLEQAAAHALRGFSPYADAVAGVTPLGLQQTNYEGMGIPTGQGAPQMPMQPGQGLPQWTQAAGAVGTGAMPAFPTIQPYTPPARPAPVPIPPTQPPVLMPSEPYPAPLPAVWPPQFPGSSE